MRKNIKTAFLIGTAMLGFTSLSLANVGGKAQMMFVQSAHNMVIKPVAHQPNHYTITIRQAEPYVSYFSDRPKRITGLMPVTKFLGFWGKNMKQGFQSDPPNVAIENKDVSLIGTLNHPRYNENKDVITYDFTVLNKPANFKNKMNYGFTSFFIDDVGWDPGGLG